MENALRTDKTMKKAVELLNNKVEYDKLLKAPTQKTKK
jgi:hypothetical protein